MIGKRESAFKAKIKTLTFHFTFISLLGCFDPNDGWICNFSYHRNCSRVAPHWRLAGYKNFKLFHGLKVLKFFFPHAIKNPASFSY